MNIIQDLIPVGRRNRPGRANPMKFVTIHETGNTTHGSNARAHGNYLRGDTAAGKPISWHYTVDDKEVRQHLPENEIAWHAGDGANGPGNTQSIGIEICVNSDGDFVAAIENAARLTADICARRGISAANIAQHNRWSGKNCPTNLRRGNPFSWAEFLRRVEAAGSASAAPTTPTASAAPAAPTTASAPAPTTASAPAPTNTATASGAKRTFRVVAGSFAKRVNAEAQVRRLKAKGVDSFIVEHNS